jgi:hypothetical protein
MMIPKDAIFLLLLISFTMNGLRYDFNETIAPIVERQKPRFLQPPTVALRLLAPLSERTFLLAYWRISERQKKSINKEKNLVMMTTCFHYHTMTSVPSRLISDPVVRHAQMLPDLLQNYTCARTQDGGSHPISTEPWMYDEKSFWRKLMNKYVPSVRAMRMTIF